ncbi:MAG: PEP-CTERM sorting domain-containing protein [Verrucomicrobiota bacterium]
MKSSIYTAAFGLLALAPVSQAQLVADFTETFSGGGGGSANTAVFTLESTTVSSFTLENSVTDGDFLDATDDGYAQIFRTATASAVNAVVGDFGTITAGDVGKVVTIDAGVRHQTGTSVDWSILLDGTDVGALGEQNYLRVNTFGSGNAASGANLLLSTVDPVAGSNGPINPGRAEGPLTYTIALADVGSTLGLRISSFDSSNQGSTGGRIFYVDSVGFSTIPEPSTYAMIAGVGVLGVAILRRRRR